MPRVFRTSPLRSRLTFSNATSLIALFVALGGSAYAAGVLPANSVGRTQLQADSVTSSKLAPNSVGRSELRTNSVTANELAGASVGASALDPALRAQLIQQAQAGAPGPRGEPGGQGPAGAEGKTGPQGPRGPAAVRVHYFEHASTFPVPKAAIDIAGLRLDAECQDGDPGTQLNFTASTDEAATFIESISADGGSGTASTASASSSNLQASLPAGTTVLGGPGAQAGQYARIVAHVIDLTQNTTVELTVAILIDGTARTCAVDGVGVPTAS